MQATLPQLDKPAPHHEMYRTAVRIGPLKAVADNGIDQRYDTQLQKKYTRVIEVPYAREVKVPTTSFTVQPFNHVVKVPVKKMNPVNTFEMVDEHYTEFEDREAVREKEVWVKTIVPEKYIERVPVSKVRQVAKPVTKYEEVDDFEDVTVTSERTVPVQGYRVDTVEDTKLVEVEEVQDYEFIPVPKGQTRPSGVVNELGVSNSHLSRSTGSIVHHADHPRIQNVPHDSSPLDPQGSGPYSRSSSSLGSPYSSFGGRRPPTAGSPYGVSAPLRNTNRSVGGGATKLWNPYLVTSSAYGHFYPRN